MRILCVDDEPDVLTVLAAALRFTLQAEVTQLTSARAAFDYLASHDLPDLIVLDGSMPAVDGYEACRRLRAHPRLATVPVVFLTARTERNERARALAAGASACLAKPFDPMTIGDQILAAWREATGR